MWIFLPALVPRILPPLIRSRTHNDLQGTYNDRISIQEITRNHVLLSYMGAQLHHSRQFLIAHLECVEHVDLEGMHMPGKNHRMQRRSQIVFGHLFQRAEHYLNVISKNYGK